MPTREDIIWFKQQFSTEIEAIVKGTPFTVNMVTALACQETGVIWPVLRKKQLRIGRLLELCVGDVIDSSPNGGRKAFPKNKAELLSKANGDLMFGIARNALLEMSHYIKSYQKAAQNPDKFCRGFGVFQYDLQHFLKNPDYFLKKKYADFASCLAVCISVLRTAQKRAKLESKASLTDFEMAAIAIAYNTGSFKPALALRQGFKPAGGKYYGEQYFDYLRIVQTVELKVNKSAAISAPAGGTAIIATPTPIEATGAFYRVDIETEPLRLRSQPVINEKNPRQNVIALMPDGHIVKAITGKKDNGFLEVETSLLGANFRGFASLKYLKPALGVTDIPIVTPAMEPPSNGLVAVYMPRKQSTITTRKQMANALSLNEPNQPTRKGNTTDKLKSELSKIIEWLGVDNRAHLRYKPNKGQTFCNLYVHDYCFLAGVYLPRVWWTQSAIRSISQGTMVKPLLGKNIEEVRANDLFRWLRDFGPEFGWRRTSTITKLQTEVNQGAVGLIVARRKEDGLSGHIVAVVPENDKFSAKRNTAGDVVAPLQSQAGTVNFKYGTGKLNWWKDVRFTEHAFWIHA